LKCDGTHAETRFRLSAKNGRVHLNRQVRQFCRTTGSRGVRISGSNAGYTMLRGSVKGTGYPLHSPVSPSLPLPCVTVCHHVSAGLYKSNWLRHVTGMNKKRMPKIMLNYRPNGRRRLGRPLKRLLDEAETGLSWPNS